jgi:hypothetical protein
MDDSISSALIFYLGPALLTELRLPFQLSPTSLAAQLRVHGLAAFGAELAVRERAAIGNGKWEMKLAVHFGIY